MKEDLRVKNNFILDLADFLRSYGFDVSEALKVSEEFYNKHKNKIKDIGFL